MRRRPDPAAAPSGRGRPGPPDGRADVLPSGDGPPLPPTQGQVGVSRRVRLLTTPLMLAVGGLISTQSLLNGTLAGELGTGLRAGALAAVISFGSGLLLLSVVVALHRRSRRGLADLRRGLRQRTLPPWMLLGGLAGAFFVASQGIATGPLGVALFIVCFVAGQSVMAMLVDHFGWGPAGRRAVSLPRLLGALLAVVAAVLSGVQVGIRADSPDLALLVTAVLPLLAGAGSSYQQGLNGRVAVRVGPWATTWNNFAVGTSALLLWLLVSLLLPGALRTPPAEPWLYLGGPIGVLFISLSTVMVRIHGVLVLGLWTVAGQITAAVVIDLLLAPEELGPLSWLAVTLTLVGVVGAMTLRTRTRSR